MCGIVGMVGGRPVAETLLDGLKRLEYRGYDSAGLATTQNGEILRRRAQGKLANLSALLGQTPLPGLIGIGHTRWATHGAPSEANAHPHATDKVAVVHNGIIENHRELREELLGLGYRFTSQTDTEIIPVLITHQLSLGKSPAEAAAAALSRLEGAFALGIIFADDPDLLIGARRGSPLAVGYGDGEMFLGSDAMALAPFTSRIAYLEEGDWVEIRKSGMVFHDAKGYIVERESKLTSLSGAAVGKGNYRHYMQKEIFEQPGVFGETVNVYLRSAENEIALPPLPFALADISKISIVACGTSFYAGMVARYWLENIAKLPVDLDIASEFRYRNITAGKGELALFISQSGETADTLAALRQAKARGQHTLAIVNAPESTMAHEADAVLFTYAGPEIGVASTKAFTTQLATLAVFALALAEARGSISSSERNFLAHTLAEVPSRMSEILHHDDSIASLAAKIMTAQDVLYMGRGTAYPIALEGALKLKEISYIHAEGYAAGELKHGPIALIDDKVPVIVIAPSDSLFEKTASNAQEAAARGGKLVIISDAKGVEQLKDLAFETITLPRVDPFVAPMLYALPIQLLAYHVAVLKGTDVDQPRNLAKSVTVE